MQLPATDSKSPSNNMSASSPSRFQSTKPKITPTSSQHSEMQVKDLLPTAEQQGLIVISGGNIGGMLALLSAAIQKKDDPSTEQKKPAYHAVLYEQRGKEATLNTRWTLDVPAIYRRLNEASQKTADEFKAQFWGKPIVAKKIINFLRQHLPELENVTIHYDTPLPALVKDDDGNYSVSGLEQKPEHIIIAEGDNSPTMQSLGNRLIKTSPAEIHMAACIELSVEPSFWQPKSIAKLLPDEQEQIKSYYEEEQPEDRKAVIDGIIMNYFQKEAKLAVQTANSTKDAGDDEITLQKITGVTDTHAPTSFILQSQILPTAVVPKHDGSGEYSNVSGLGNSCATGHYDANAGATTAQKQAEAFYKLLKAKSDNDTHEEKQEKLKGYNDTILDFSMLWNRSSAPSLYPNPNKVDSGEIKDIMEEAIKELLSKTLPEAQFIPTVKERIQNIHATDHAS